MNERPSQTWKREKTEQQAKVDAGTLSPGSSYLLDVSDTFITAIDHALATYEQQVAQLPPGAPDDRIWAAVRICVEAINEADEDIDTVTREELAEYLDVVLGKAGIDVDALTTRSNLDRSELTDQWRDW